MQRMSSAVTEEVILEELQVFKVTFTVPLAREWAVRWSQVGDMWGWRVRAVTALLVTGRSQGCEGRGWLGYFHPPQNIPDALPSPGGSE